MDIHVKNLLRIIKFSPSFIIICVGIFVMFIMYNEQERELKEEQKFIEKQFIQDEKERIKLRISTIYDFIKDEDTNIEIELKKKLKYDVDNVYKIMDNIYKENINKKSKKEIIDEIKRSLRVIRFNEGRTYIVLVTTNAMSVLQPLIPHREGTNVYNIRTKSGKYPLHDFIKISKSPMSEGFSEYYFHKFGDKKNEYKKISFVKAFKKLDLIIIVGDYIDDFKLDIQNKALKHISKLKYKDDAYIFTIHFNGKLIYHPFEKAINGNIFKENRFSHIAKDFKTLLLKEGEDVGNYISILPKVVEGKDTEETKITYAKRFDKWEWIISTSFKLSDANNIIEKRKKILEKKYDAYKEDILLYGIFFTIIMILISFYISKLLERKFLEYKESLENQVLENKTQNERLLKAQEVAHIGDWRLDLKTNKASWSDEIIRILCLDKKDENKFGPEFLKGIMIKEDVSTFEDSLTRCIKEGVEHECIYRIKRPDGDIRWIDCRGRLNEQEQFIIGTIQDITQKKEVEIHLLEKEELYRALMKQSPYSVVVHDKNGFLIETNKAHAELWGFDTSKVINKFNILTDTSFKDSGLFKYIKKAYSGEIVNIPVHEFDPTTSTTVVSKAKRKLITAKVYPIKNIYNKVNGIVIIQMDVSFEYQARKRDEILTSVFQVLPDLLFIMKSDGEIIDYRAQENSNLYAKPEIFLGKMMQEVLPKDVGEIIDTNIKDLSESNNLKVFRYQLEIEGNLKYFEARMAKLPLYENIMIIIRDITEQEIMKKDNLLQEKILYQQSKMAAMGEMIGNIAHQWRQPLSTISTASTGVKLQKEMDCLSDSQLDSALTVINDSAQYLSTTIDDFRSFFNPSNNKTSEFLVTSAIEKTLNLVSAQFVTKEIEIIKNIEDVSILSIENELIQALVNIFNNSRDALLTLEKEKRYIFIDVYENKNELIIEIKDNAKGIAEDIIEKVFEPYFTTKHQSQGTGIGLYMTEEMLRIHLNGSISVLNDTYFYEGIEYTGAKFTIKIALD